MAPLSELPSPQTAEPGFSVSHQKIELDIDLRNRSLRGRSEITLNPHSRDLKLIRLNCRQCDFKRISVNGKPCSGVTYEDPYKRTTLPWKAGVHQYHMLQQKLDGQLRRNPEAELTVVLPKSLKIDDLDPFSDEAQNVLLSKSVGSSKGDGSANALDPAQNSRAAGDQSARFTPVQLNIEFVIERIRDGMQFVGWEEGDLRYPHAFSANSTFPGAASSLFPCVDDLTARCTWEISIKCPKTLGDALGYSTYQPQPDGKNGLSAKADGLNGGVSIKRQGELSEDDRALDLAVVCTGDMTDEVGEIGVILDFD